MKGKTIILTFIILILLMIIAAGAAEEAAGDKNTRNVSDQKNSISEIDSVFMGEYDLINDPYDEAVPMEWYIVDYDDGVFTLLSRYAVAERRMNSVPEAGWKDTELKRWLDQEFYSNAFNDEEKTYIIEQYDGFVTLPSIGLDLYRIGDSRTADEYPEIMTLEKTEDFQQDKWWLKNPTQLWWGLGGDETNIRPAYDSKLFSRGEGRGMGYYEAATYYAVASDEQAENGYSVLEYGYPINEALAVRPILIVDDEYVLTQMGAKAPDPKGKEAIRIEPLIDAFRQPEGNILDILSRVFGDVSGVDFESGKSSGDDRWIEEVWRCSSTQEFLWDGHRVEYISVRATRYKEEIRDDISYTVYLSIKDLSEENKYTISEKYASTLQYYETSENWEQGKDKYPYADYSRDAGMYMDRREVLRYTDAAYREYEKAAEISFDIAFNGPDTDLEAMFSCGKPENTSAAGYADDADMTESNEENNSDKLAEILSDKQKKVDSVHSELREDGGVTITPTRRDDEKDAGKEDAGNDESGVPTDLPAGETHQDRDNAKGSAVGASGNTIFAYVSLKNNLITECSIEDDMATREMRRGYDLVERAVIGMEGQSIMSWAPKEIFKVVKDYAAQAGEKISNGGEDRFSINNAIKAIKDALE